MKKIKRKIFLATILLSINLTNCFTMENNCTQLDASINSEKPLDNAIEKLKETQKKLQKQFSLNNFKFNAIYDNIFIYIREKIKSIEIEKIFDEDNDLFDLNRISFRYKENKESSNTYFSLEEVKKIYNDFLKIKDECTKKINDLICKLNYQKEYYKNFKIKIDNDYLSNIEYKTALNTLNEYCTNTAKKIEKEIDKITKFKEETLKEIDNIINQLKIFNIENYTNDNLYEFFNKNIREEVKNIIEEIVDKTNIQLNNEKNNIKEFLKNKILKLYGLQLKVISCLYNTKEKKEEIINKIKNNLLKLLEDTPNKDRIELILNLYKATYEVLEKIRNEKNKEILNLNEKTNILTKNEYNTILRKQRKFLLDSKKIINSIKKIANLIKTDSSLENDKNLKKNEQNLENLQNQIQDDLFSIESLKVNFNNDLQKEYMDIYENIFNQIKNISIDKETANSIKTSPNLEYNKTSDKKLSLERLKDIKNSNDLQYTETKDISDDIKFKTQKLENFIPHLTQIIYNIYIAKKYDEYEEMRMYDFFNNLELTNKEKQHLEKIFKQLTIKIYEIIKTKQNEYIEKNFLNNMKLSSMFKYENSYESIIEYLNYIINNIDNFADIENYIPNNDKSYFEKQIEKNCNLKIMLDEFLDNYIYPELKSVENFIKNNKEYEENNGTFERNLETYEYISFLNEKINYITEKCFENINYKNNKNLNDKEKQDLKNEIDKYFNKIIESCSNKFSSTNGSSNITKIFKKEYEENLNLFNLNDKNNDISTLQPFLNLDKKNADDLLKNYENLKNNLEKIQINISEIFKNFIESKSKNLNPAIKSTNNLIPEKIIKYANEKENILKDVIDKIIDKINYLIQQLEIFYKQEYKNDRLNKIVRNNINNKIESKIFSIMYTINLPQNIEYKIQNKIIETLQNCMLKLCALKSKEISYFYEKQENKEELENIMKNIKSDLEEIYKNKYNGDPEKLIEELHKSAYKILKEELLYTKTKLKREKYKLKIDKTYSNELNADLLKEQKEFYLENEIIIDSIEEIEKMTKEINKKPLIEEINKNSLKKESLKNIQKDLYENLLESKKFYSTFKNIKIPENIKILNKIIGISPIDITNEEKIKA